MDGLQSACHPLLEDDCVLGNTETGCEEPNQLLVGFSSLWWCMQAYLESPVMLSLEIGPGGTGRNTEQQEGSPILVNSTPGGHGRSLEFHAGESCNPDDVRVYKHPVGDSVGILAEECSVGVVLVGEFREDAEVLAVIPAQAPLAAQDHLLLGSLWQDIPITGVCASYNHAVVSL